MATMGTARVTVVRLARLGNGAEEGPAWGRRVRPGCLRMTQDPGRRAFLNILFTRAFLFGEEVERTDNSVVATLSALEYPSLSPPYVADFVAALHASRLQASTVRFLYLGPGTDQKFGFWGGPSPRTFEFADF